MHQKQQQCLKAQYEEREIESFDQLRLHGYLCRQKNQIKNGLY